jgi:hypothetical protein
MGNKYCLTTWALSSGVSMLAVILKLAPVLKGLVLRVLHSVLNRLIGKSRSPVWVS